MDIIILMVALGVVLFTVISVAGYLVLGGVNIKKRLRMDVLPEDDKPNIPAWHSIKKRYEKVAKPLGELIPRSPDEMSRQERRMVQAGIRRKDNVSLLYGTKLLTAIFFVLVSVATGVIWGNILLCIAVSIFLGMLIPDLWLKYAIATRTDKIQRALPNALDLAVVCIEAGMGLDQALQRIGQEMKKGFQELSDELNVLSLEIRAGRTRAEALRNLASRTQSTDLKSFVAVLIQTDRFGTSIAQSLRTFADTMRTTRRLRAEEHAAKMTIKLVPPLVFFIFPAIMIIMLGPAFIRIGEVLKTLGGN
jgi:tight adherence protein C